MKPVPTVGNRELYETVYEQIKKNIFRIYQLNLPHKIDTGYLKNQCKTPYIDQDGNQITMKTLGEHTRYC